MGLCPELDLALTMKPMRTLTDDSLRTHVITPPLCFISRRSMYHSHLDFLLSSGSYGGDQGFSFLSSLLGA